MPNLTAFTVSPLFLAIAALTLSGCASKPERGGRGGGAKADRGGSYQGGIIARPIAILLTGMDANGDYQVSNAELAEGVEIEWANLSRGKPGKVSAIELADWAKQVMGSAEAMPNSISFDTDLNAQITELEFGDRLRAEFALLDKDKDWNLTRAELVSRLPAPNIQDRRQGSGGRGEGRGSGGGDRPRR